MTGLKKSLPNLTPDKVLTLELEAVEDQQFPLVWCIASFLSTLWHLRSEKKRVELIKIRSEIEANCRLLRESRLVKTKEILAQIFQSC